MRITDFLSLSLLYVGTVFYQVHFTSVLSEYEITVRQQRRAKIQVVISLVALMMQIIMYALSFFVANKSYESLAAYIGGAVNIMAGCSFPVYLYYLYRKRNLLMPRARYQHRLLQCLTVTLLVSVCAVLRGAVALVWGSVTSQMSREVYWVWCSCVYAVTSQLPIAWLLVLFKVVSFDTFVLVGTPDSEYWISASPKSVAGHDFFLLQDNGKEDGSTSSSSSTE